MLVLGLPYNFMDFELFAIKDVIISTALSAVYGLVSHSLLNDKLELKRPLEIM